MVAKIKSANFTQFARVMESLKQVASAQNIVKKEL